MALEPDDVPPAEVTRELFDAWRAPRVGAANPERLTNPVWAWLARRREVNAYQANAHFGGPSSMTAGTCWCCNRFGQSVTALPDGRTISIGGEHEDYYDPDFYIYNDVIVVDAADGVELYGYPHDVFPPTDFHTATLIGTRILIIGCLGYRPQRVAGTTPVYALDTATLAISPVATTGDVPGWICKHTATLSADGATITVRRGDVAFTVGMAAFWARDTSAFDVAQLAEQIARLGRVPDYAAYAARYSPPIAHVEVPRDEDEIALATRVIVDDVTVRYVETSAHVQITIEGTLADDQIAAIVEDARAKLEVAEAVPYAARQLRA